jgi:hypothetical protein
VLDIDLSQIDDYDTTYDQCDTKITDAIHYLRFTIIPILANFTEVEKENQLIQIDEVVSFTSELTHLLKTVHNLDINKGVTQDYHSEETTADEDSETVQCVS